MLIQVFPVMVIELMICMCQTSRFTYILALNVLYNITETLYTAYYAIGLLAYVFALLSYLPYIVSFLRMACRDTETTRLIFSRNCIRLWMFAVAIDAWVFFYLASDVNELCEVMQLLPDERKLAQEFKVDRIHPDTILQLCNYRVQMHRLLAMAVNHFQYALMCYVTQRHWRNKRYQRLKDQRRFTERIVSRQITVQDWSRCMRESWNLPLLIDPLCPYRLAILGTVLIDKEISESKDYVSLAAKMRGPSRDMKWLRILVESRIRQRLALQVPDDVVKELKDLNENPPEQRKQEFFESKVARQKAELERANHPSKRYLQKLLKNAGKEGPEDVTFHKEIINQLCSKKTSVEVILTGYLLSRYQHSKQGANAAGKAAAEKSPTRQNQETKAEAALRAIQENLANEESKVKVEKDDAAQKRMKLQNLPKHYDPRSYY